MTYTPTDLANETPWQGWDTSQDIPSNPGALTPTPTLPQQAGVVPPGAPPGQGGLVIDIPGGSGGRGGAGYGQPQSPAPGQPPIPPPPQAGPLPQPPQRLPAAPPGTMPPGGGPIPAPPGGGTGGPPGATGAVPPGKPKQPANQPLVDRILDIITGKAKKAREDETQKMLQQAMALGAQSTMTGRPPGAPEGRLLDTNSQIRQLLSRSDPRGVERSPFVVPGSPSRQYPGYPQAQGQPQAQAPQGPPQGALRMMRGGYPFQYLNSAPGLPIREMARGGQRQSYVPGDGNSGRSDQVEARLSPNEYVIDAETVALLGDGSPDHGAKKLDKFRNNIRQHKGRALAKGRISSDARTPESYL